MSACPKPTKRATARRAHNSTLPASVPTIRGERDEKTGAIRFIHSKPRKPIARKSGLNSSRNSKSSPRKPIAKRNAKREAKRRVSYAKGLAAYRNSDTAKIVKARAGGRCEAILVFSTSMLSFHELLDVRAPGTEGKRQVQEGETRCLATEKLSDHHLTYARFGGKELPEDICKCCPRCHAWFEAEHTTRKRSRLDSQEGRGR